jgi:uncharacterized protein (UPF0276 family)
MSRQNSSIGLPSTPLTDKVSRLRPKFATTYQGGDPAFLESLLPWVDYIEVTPDSIAEFSEGKYSLHKPIMSELKSLDKDVQIVVHGVGLSIGSFDGYSQHYIQLLDDLMEQLNVAWHSEHLGYTMVDGEFLGTMLPLPETEEVLDLVCERVVALQERYDLPFLLENVAHILPKGKGNYSEAEFLNALTTRTNCGLLLDIYNLECDAHNHGFDIDAFLAQLNVKTIRELHVANGVEHQGFLLDIHSRLTRDSTIALAQKVLSLAKETICTLTLTYEFLEEAVPVLGHQAIVDELVRLQKACCI